MPNTLRLVANRKLPAGAFTAMLGIPVAVAMFTGIGRGTPVLLGRRRGRVRSLKWADDLAELGGTSEAGCMIEVVFPGAGGIDSISVTVKL